MSIRIVIISDTHNRHSRVTLPKGDILIHCGDATGVGKISEITSFRKWFKAQPFRYKIFTMGNHEVSFEDNFTIAKLMLNLEEGKGEYLLHDESCVVDGIKIHGNCWQPAFNGWAFGKDSEEELAEKYSTIPSDTDVLVTHSPPYGILDQCADGRKVGSFSLLEKIREVKPWLSVFGHIHEGYGTLKLQDLRTTFANAAICDLVYHPGNKPIVYDWESKQVVSSGE